MVGGRLRALIRAGVVSAVVAAMLASSASVLAAKPPKPPKPPNLSITPVIDGSTTTITYQVHLDASALGSVACFLTYPDGTSILLCDNTPDKGSGKKQTKYSVTASTPKGGTYSYSVEFGLVGGGSVEKSISFVNPSNAAVRFSVTGLVPHETVCYFTLPEDCQDFPGPDYPRQIAKITALDAFGNVATGYNGTVTFRHPIDGVTPEGLSDMQLTNGVGYAPVAAHTLSLAVTECDGVTGGGAFTVTDTVDPTIFGCQHAPGAGILIFSPTQAWLDAHPDGCPDGCFEDPTGTIVIDTIEVVPLSLTPTIAVDQSLLMTGVTFSDFYFTQSITVGQLTIVGTSIPADDLALCALCTPELSYIPPTGTAVINATSGLLIGGNTVQTEALVVMGWDAPDEPEDTTPVFISGPVIGAATPTCYADSQLSIVVGGETCR